MEETKCLKPSDNGHDLGDRASVQAATRVNAEHPLRTRSPMSLGLVTVIEPSDPAV
jgi:hypothetical protein